MMPLAQRDRPLARAANGLTVTRPLLLSGARVLVITFTSLPLLRAAPTRNAPFTTLDEDEELPMPAHSPTLWIYMAVAVGLVLLGGVFAGLTIALMGQVSRLNFLRVTS